MPHSYQNVSREKDVSSYIDVVQPLTGLSAVFRSKTAVYTPQKGIGVFMTSGSVRSELEQAVTLCGEPCPITIRPQVEVRFNVQKGDVTTLNLLKAEVDRLFAEAVSSYNLALGLVPPSEADFPEV